MSDERRSFIEERAAILIHDAGIDPFDADKKAEAMWYEYQESLKPQQALF